MVTQSKLFSLFVHTHTHTHRDRQTHTHTQRIKTFFIIFEQHIHAINQSYFINETFEKY